ncbi:MAG TPA: TIGR03618 family F420-dependent PPOX class oxidoreductase [Jatrophihabitantaceae bacterium]|nr:TIGR03618 family F420-dependent PPOX class oxidoreductase [Jatrophihabitantaceae bacterium]
MPALTPDRLSSAGVQFLTERHLATFTSLRPDGAPHVTPVGFTWDVERHLARVITSGHSRKARNVGDGSPVVLCQLDGRRWLSLEGIARVASDTAAVREAEARYEQRYRAPRENPARVAIEISVTRLLGSAEFFVDAV